MDANWYNKKITRFEFGQTDVSSNKFNNHKKLTDLMNTDVNKVAASDKMSYINGKDCRYVIECQINGKTVIPFIETPNNLYMIICDKKVM